MSWQCRLIEWEDRDRIRAENDGKLPIGTMWYARDLLKPDQIEKSRRNILSVEYFEINSHRPPLIVILPSGDWFNIDSHVTGERHGWHVSGDAPDITVSPSINLVGIWWLQNGIISDDCEGRSFNE